MNLRQIPHACAAISLAVAGLTSTASAQTYRLGLLPSVPGSEFGPYEHYGMPSINNLGDVAWTRAESLTFHGPGYDFDYTGPRATVYRDGVAVRDIAPLVALGQNRATAINDHGTVVGQSYTAGTQIFDGPRGGTTITGLHAYINKNGQSTDLGATLNGRDYDLSLATAVNSKGQVVGYVGELNVSTQSDTRRAFIYSNGQMTALTASEPGSSYIPDVSYATDINDNSVVVGSFFVPDETSSYSHFERYGYFHAFSYQDGTLTDLSALASGGFSFANAINNAGAVVGSISSDPNSFKSAALFFNGVTTVLGSGNALDINDAGVIVGNSGNHGFVYRDGQMIDLNTLLSGSLQGWEITQALKINNQGTILAMGRNTATGELQYVQLAAVPEPQSLALLIAGLAAVGVAGRASRRQRSAN